MSQELMVLIAGVAASLVTAGAKLAYKKVSGNDLPSTVAAYLTYLVCFVAALVGKVMAGQAVLPEGGPEVVVPTLGVWLAEVIGVATVTYNTLLKKDTRLFSR